MLLLGGGRPLELHEANKDFQRKHNKREENRKIKEETNHVMGPTKNILMWDPILPKAHHKKHCSAIPFIFDETKKIHKISSSGKRGIITKSSQTNCFRYLKLLSPSYLSQANEQCGILLQKRRIF